ncbi:MAG: CDP-alcohol phosphatidyltransferase family protein [Deltaproteobacteria bacterium]|nr:CDP-alcohol phosphatidyltransferase family protein [Deltaproteobacteria bacterium]
MSEPPRIVPKPAFVDAVEQALGRARIFDSRALHPHVLSALKVVVVTPLLALTLKQIDVLPGGLTIAVLLFMLFAVLDGLDGVVARVRGLESEFGRVFDRVCDLPLLGLIAWFAWTSLPASETVSTFGALIAAKLALDVVLLVLFAIKRTTTENRIRTSLSDATLLALLLLSQGAGAPLRSPAAPDLVSTEVVQALLVVNIAFSAFIGLVNAGALKKRFIADGLSMMNALCGAFSIALAMDGQPAWCLLLLLVGAGFDGLDGAAARKWGGTRFGVLADDIADGISYALAPAVAVAVVVAGRAGVVIGFAYALFTIGRLVFFTLNKGSADDDPRFFRGVPSTIGGVVALCAAILFPDEPALVGFLCGVAVVLMVGFDSAYRHLGRVLFGLRREKQLIALSAAIVLLASSVLLGPRVAAGILLGGSLLYGFLPQIARFQQIISKQRSALQAAGVTTTTAPSSAVSSDSKEIPK